jgi:hypothetical protein
MILVTCVIAPADAEPESRRLKGSKMPIHRLLQSNFLALALRLLLDKAEGLWHAQTGTRRARRSDDQQSHGGS